MSRDVVRVGLIGLGVMGQNHLRNLAMMKQVEVAFIYDFDKQTCQRLAETYNVSISDDLNRDLQNVDAAIIVTPTSTHFEYINVAAQYVKNIFVEKPLTNDSETTRVVSQLVKNK